MRTPNPNTEQEFCLDPDSAGTIQTLSPRELGSLRAQDLPDDCILSVAEVGEDPPGAEDEGLFLMSHSEGTMVEVGYGWEYENGSEAQEHHAETLCVLFSHAVEELPENTSPRSYPYRIGEGRAFVSYTIVLGKASLADSYEEALALDCQLWEQVRRTERTDQAAFLMAKNHRDIEPLIPPHQYLGLSTEERTENMSMLFDALIRMGEARGVSSTGTYCTVRASEDGYRVSGGRPGREVVRTPEPLQGGVEALVTWMERHGLPAAGLFWE